MIVIMMMLFAVAVWAVINIAFFAVYARRADGEGVEVGTESHGRSPASEANGNWQAELRALPGISGWALLDQERVIADSGEPGTGEIGASLRRFIDWFMEHSMRFGDEQVRMLELETERGNIIVLFSREADCNARLILFIDQEIYKNQLRETLANLSWESGLHIAG